MKIIDQSWQWLQKPINPLELIELAGRTCYKSEHRINKGSALKFVKHIIELGHETVIEHISATVRFITNRSTTHSIVRHRLCSFSQESTRYVKYNNVEFIKPICWESSDYPEECKEIWRKAMEEAEKSYMAALRAGDHPEQAREILPHSLKTEIVVTANLREWRHIFNLRCSIHAHSQIRALMCNCLQGFSQEIPSIFDDLIEKYITKSVT